MSRKSIKLSQHFLTSRTILSGIARALEICKDDFVVEVGGGHGELTRFLLDAKRVLVLEKDVRLAKIGGETFGDLSHVEICNQDFLDLDLDSLGGLYKLVGNIPYAITGKIIRKVLDAVYPPAIAVFTLQKEVGEKLLGEPRSNFLSNVLHLRATVEKVRIVRAGSFFPKPKVDSMVVRLRFNKIQEPDSPAITTFLKACFASPKKTLANNLKRVIPGVDLKKILEEQGISETVRPHELPLEHLQKLFYRLQ